MSSLNKEQIALQLDTLPYWTSNGHHITRTYQFADFASVIAFMTHAAFYAQQLEHYPHWQNYYNQLIVTIGESEHGTLHSRDIQLARRLEGIFERFAV